MKKLDVGIIGLGNAGFSHYRWFNMNPRANVKSVFSLDAEEKKRTFWFRKAHFATSPEEVISSVDAVSICSPDKTHFQYIKLALEQGKHILIEKPIVVERAHLEEIDRLTAEHPDLKVAVHNQMRVVPTFAKIKRIIQEDPNFADVFQIMVTYRHNCRLIKGLDWRMRDDQNFLLGATVHPFDYALWLFDFEELERVELMENRISWKEYPSATNFSVMFQTRSGRLAYINGNSSMVWPFYADCTVMADRGSMVNNLMYRDGGFRFFHNNRVTYGGYSLYPLNALIWLFNRLMIRVKGFHAPPFTVWEWSRASRMIADNFVDAVLTGKNVLVPYQSARKSMSILLDLDAQRKQSVRQGSAG